MQIAWQPEAYYGQKTDGNFWVQVWEGMEGAGPYLGILRPWAQEKFAPPPPLICSYSVMCKQKQHKKLTKDKTL